MIKKFGKFKVNVLATSRSSSWYYANNNKILKYGDMVCYADAYSSVYFGWYIGDSPSGASQYMLTTHNSVINCKLSLLGFNWLSGIDDIIDRHNYVDRHNYEVALKQIEDNRP